MKILMTNDDGYNAIGLNSLYDELSKFHDVIVVAPSEEKSACSHSITCNKTLKFIEVKKNFFKLESGTPADCIHLGLHKFYGDKLPDLVVSGINYGGNLCEDITYSGTCGGAMEATLQGIPAIAISQFLNEEEFSGDFSLAVKISIKVIDKIFSNNFPLNYREFLNLNIPPVKESDYKGLKVAPVGYKNYLIAPLKNTNPKGEEYFWLGKNTFEYPLSLNQFTDIHLIMQNYATLSPITMNLTAHKSLKNLEIWCDE